jgi:hypothetical protein
VEELVERICVIIQVRVKHIQLLIKQ